MDSFQAALKLVHDALSSLETRGSHLRASVESLAQLAASKSAVITVAPLDKVSPFGRPSEEVQPTFEAPRTVPPVVAVPVIPKLPFPSDLRIPAAAPAPETQNADQIGSLREIVLSCAKCPALVASRTQVVFGIGNPNAELMFVGEAPGADEDRAGEPFVGAAGQLLTKIIETMGFPRDTVYIANVLKCRPNMPAGASGNRKPSSSEMQTCLPYLERQIAIIKPRVLVALGATAMEGLLGEVSPMNRLRGRWHDFRGTPLMATYHPAYLLRNQSLGEKRKVWEDMLLVIERLGRKITERQRGFFLQKG